MKSPPQTREAGPPRKEPTSIGSIVRQIVSLRATFRNLNWNGRVKFIRILIPQLPKIALAITRYAFSCIKVERAQRAVKRADEKRRMERRWKP